MVGMQTRSLTRWSSYALCIALLATIMVFSSTSAHAAWSQFRGPNRNGKTDETGLMDEWPDGGPEQLWMNEDIGFGFSSASVTDDMIYTTGLEEKKGYIYAINMDGELEWKKSYGKGWTGAHPGTRTTPTVDDGKLYIMSGHGVAACFDAEDGEEIWSVDTMEKFGAPQVTWGITESPLVMEDKVIFTPGGDKAGMVALNPDTGATIWVCKGINDKTGYCSPIAIERGGKTIIAQLLATTFVGVNAENGDLLWRVERDPTPKYKIQAVSPVYDDGMFYVTSGYGGRRGQMFKLSQDGTKVTRGWGDSELDVHHGGVVLLEGNIYGASDRNNRRKWLCLDLETGKVESMTDGVGKGCVVFADGLLYGYGENGKVGLINPDPDNYELISSFRIREGRGPNWAHPSISDGRMYIRHGEKLFAFDISD